MNLPAEIEPRPVKEDGRLLRGEATREKVLDAAERLFADHGFDGVSIRQIAQEAGVTLGVVGFHGGAKLELFKTLLARRVDALSAARRKGLAELDAASGGKPAIRDLMEAYIRPYIAVASGGDVQWRAYARLIARTVSEDRWYPVVRDLYDPVAIEYIAAIKRTHPDADRGRLAAGLVMAVASMLSVVASSVRIEHLSGRVGEGGADYAESLIDFCAGGMEKAALARAM